jgi:hypothetical protein
MQLLARGKDVEGLLPALAAQGHVTPWWALIRSRAPAGSSLSSTSNPLLPLAKFA